MHASSQAASANAASSSSAALASSSLASASASAVPAAPKSKPSSSAKHAPPLSAVASAPKLKSATPAVVHSSAAPATKAATAAASSKPLKSQVGARFAGPLHSAAPPLSSRKAASPSSSSSATAAPSRPRSVVHRSLQAGPIVIRVVESDIALIDVTAVVNAANSLSFTPMDGGISGALRRAMGPDCTGKKKMWWDDEGGQHDDVKLPVTQAGVQAATGALLARGVQHVIHAVGPTWTDFAISESTFKRVMPMIRRTARRALVAASRMHATSCAMPAISGGIFTHYRADQPEVKNREQRAARRAVVEAVLDWALDQAQLEVRSSVESVLLCDLSKKELGAVHVFVEEFDAVVNERKQKLEELAASTEVAVAAGNAAASAAPAEAAAAEPAAAYHITAASSSAGSSSPDASVLSKSSLSESELGSKQGADADSTASAASIGAQAVPSPARL